MPCACNQTRYTVVRPDGSRTSYETRIQADAEARRSGGYVE